MNRPFSRPPTVALVQGIRLSHRRARQLATAGRLLGSYFLLRRGGLERAEWAVRSAWAALRAGGIPEVWRRSSILLSRLHTEVATAQRYRLEERTVPLAFPAAAEPIVSIVMPVYRQWQYTFTSLKALLANTQGVQYELIVVDDASDDETPAMLRFMQGVQVIRHQQNRGFLAACMSGAEVARGRYLVFLNNDTIVRPNWLSSLMETFRVHPEAGLVGAKLLTPSGRLQEAGALVYRDGSARHYGRTDDPNRPEYNYVREVDYCSGACVMVPREIFFSCGGFDRRFSPAYYEDTDLAFAIRRAGKRVLYQPKAEVVHFEGATSGTDVRSGPKRYQILNQRTFQGKWAGVLERHGPPGADPDCERDRYSRGRILVIDHQVPTPDRDSGSLRLAGLLRVLRECGYQVTMIPDDLAAPTPYTELLQTQGIEVLHFPYLREMPSFLKSRAARYDVAILCRQTVATKYIDVLRLAAPDTSVIFDTVDLHFLREQRRALVENDQQALRRALALEQEECRIVRLADLTFAVSEVELTVLEREVPGAWVEVLSNIHAVAEPVAQFAPRRGIMFIGTYDYPPNVDAVSYFAHDIWPHVQKALPDATFHIVGDNPPARIRALAGAQIVVTGYVPDVAEYFHRCRISVAPLRYGAGVKGKINQSMSYGVPVVATPVAAEGMHLVDEESVLIAGTPEEFAKAVVRAYRDEALWTRLSVNGLENVRRYFSFEVARKTVQEVLSRLPCGERGSTGSRSQPAGAEDKSPATVSS